MINNMIKKRNKQGGFSFVELMIALLIFVILIAVVILATQGFFTKARGTSMQGDIHTVKNAVDAYMLQSFKAPTENGMLPQSGEYALIDFNASFTQEGKTYKFYPGFLAKLPRHSGEGVWRIDNAGMVSIDMAGDKY